MEQISQVENPKELHQKLVTSFTKFESGFRTNYPVAWWFTLLAPAVMSGVLLIFLGFLYGWDYPQKLIAHALMTFFIFGRLIILCGSEGELLEEYRIALSPGELYAMVTYLDFIVALFVTFHMGVLFRIPYVGPKIAMLVWDGKFILDSQPWVKRMAFFGLIIFVIFPTSTTGSIGGSIFGRLLGLSRFATVSGILIGSLLGNGIMYVFARQINQFITPDNFWLKILGVVILIALIALVEVRYQMVKRKYLVKEGVDPEAEGKPTSDPVVEDLESSHMAAGDGSKLVSPADTATAQEPMES